MMTSCCLLVAALRVFYPSDAFRLETTAVTSSWPGRHVSATAGAIDLSSAGEIAIALSNRLDRPLKVTLSV